MKIYALGCDGSVAFFSSREKAAEYCASAYDDLLDEPDIRQEMIDADMDDLREITLDNGSIEEF